MSSTESGLMDRLAAGLRIAAADSDCSGAFSDLMAQARAAWLLNPGATIHVYQTLYSTCAWCAVGAQIRGRGSDGSRDYAEAAALAEALGR